VAGLTNLLQQSFQFLQRLLGGPLPFLKGVGDLLGSVADADQVGFRAALSATSFSITSAG